MGEASLKREYTCIVLYTGLGSWAGKLKVAGSIPIAEDASNVGTVGAVC